MMSACTAAVTSPAPIRRRGLTGWLALIGSAFSARRQRDHLRVLDARLLDDIGLSPRLAEEEAARPLWDVPKHWLK